MARAGAVVARAHDAVRDALAAGVTTQDLDAVAAEVIADAGATASFLGYRGFPATLCVSVGDEVVHGIPGDRVLRDGDVVSVDCGAVVDGFHADAAVTWVVGGDAAADEPTADLVATTHRALWAGLRACEPGNRLGDVGAAVQGVAEAGGYGISAGYVGHGIGRALHEDPSVPNRGTPGTGLLLVEGLVLAVEPMLALGGDATVKLDDGWTAVTADGSLAAHFEHTVAITRDGPWVLTAREDEPSRL